jgi:hypothetical protein
LKNERAIGYNGVIVANLDGWGQSMMGERKVQHDALFYEFSLERHVPERHLLRSIDRFVELDGLRRQLEPFYSATGRPSTSPPPPRTFESSLCWFQWEHKQPSGVEPPS